MEKKNASFKLTFITNTDSKTKVKEMTSLKKIEDILNRIGKLDSLTRDYFIKRALPEYLNECSSTEQRQPEAASGIRMNIPRHLDEVADPIPDGIRPEHQRRA